MMLDCPEVPLSAAPSTAHIRYTAVVVSGGRVCAPDRCGCFDVAVARVKAMADWKRLTSPSGDKVYLNLDVMIGMQRNPDINITFLQSLSDPRVSIEVRETPDEILSASST